MQHVTSARIVRGALTAVLFLSGFADAAGVLAATPTAKPAQSSTLRKVQLSRGAAAPAAANPLRSALPPKTPPPAPAVQVSQPTDLSPAKATPVPPATSQKPFVPNTGRLQIFRAAEKPVIGVPKTGDVHRLFPKGAVKATASAIPVMRYEDVARGAALVPVTPRANAPAQPSMKLQAPPAATADSAIAPEVDAPVKRLPPLDRTGPRPRLPAGVKLPQEPINIYPETDS
jgi:hypothetical protein